MRVHSAIQNSQSVPRRAAGLIPVILLWRCADKRRCRSRRVFQVRNPATLRRSCESCGPSGGPAIRWKSAAAGPKRNRSPNEVHEAVLRYTPGLCREMWRGFGLVNSRCSDCRIIAAIFELACRKIVLLGAPRLGEATALALTCCAKSLQTFLGRLQLREAAAFLLHQVILNPAAIFRGLKQRLPIRHTFAKQN